MSQELAESSGAGLESEEINEPHRMVAERSAEMAQIVEDLGSTVRHHPRVLPAMNDAGAASAGSAARELGSVTVTRAPRPSTLEAVTVPP